MFILLSSTAVATQTNTHTHTHTNNTLKVGVEPAHQQTTQAIVNFKAVNVFNVRICLHAVSALTK